MPILATGPRLFSSAIRSKNKRVFGTDGKPKNEQNPLGPFLGPRSGKSVQEAGQSGTEETNAPQDAIRDNAVVLLDFQGRKLKGPSRIRTGDGGFAIRCQRATTLSSSSSLGRRPVTEVPTMVPEETIQEFPPDLAQIVAAWINLPDVIKAGIRALVRAAADVKE
ncbi:MAG TPA: hypothetical protein VKE98_00620 [Gemmataceae bacterium]|nr:hypothetical protein [Gemmataceae bacterium]